MVAKTVREWVTGPDGKKVRNEQWWWEASQRSQLAVWE